MHHTYEWVVEAHSFEHGVTIATNMQERMGLIGRTYILSECGKQGWIK